MEEENLLKLNLTKGQLILIHLISGKAICGAYLANYNSNRLEFEFDNHRTGKVENIKLSEVADLVT